ncbi:hypothetical protein QE152_g4096 [Popillia japonica]|uniref:Uncharacterized protein n=1 Tax=Popillia japonica TaxID=7064 RepID=A0AAW1N2A7_POPJA
MSVGVHGVPVYVVEPLLREVPTLRRIPSLLRQRRVTPASPLPTRCWNPQGSGGYPPGECVIESYRLTSSFLEDTKPHSETRLPLKSSTHDYIHMYICDKKRNISNYLPENKISKN